MEPPRVPPPGELEFTARLSTRWSDEDTQGVLNNAVYLTLLEEARYRYFGSLGLLEGNCFPFVLMQTNGRFLRPGRGGAEVEVACATTHLGKSSFTQAYRVSPSDGGEPWFEAEALLVAWDEQKRTSKPMDEAFRRAVAAFEGLA